MICINSFRDLEQFGIHYLTGEADALSFRGLCDLTKQGRAIVADAFGLRFDSFNENWNNGSADDPHVASVMLSRDCVSTIAIIALVSKCHTVFSLDNGSICGLEDDESIIRAEYDIDPATDTIVETKPYQYTRQDLTMPWPTCYGTIQRFYCHSANHHVGNRNVHAMSGRVD